jgi:phosphoesterase RecJ-like protein
MEHLTSDPAVWQNPPWDLIIVCDSGDLGYAGVDTYISALTKKIPVVNIDHHVSNTRYGDAKLVVDTASSTCEVLYHFFAVNHIPVNPHMALSLLTGLMYDTDNFTNGATSRTALAIGSDLVRRGADLSFVRHALFQNKSIPTLQVWGSVLGRLTKVPDLDLTYTFITMRDLTERELEEKDAEGIANFLSTLGETDISMFLKETKTGDVKGSFRTTHDVHDVSLMAKKFGGGGHKKAAGFTVPGPMDSAVTHILDTLRAMK